MNSLEPIEFVQELPGEESEELDQLIEKIQAGECVLFLGPDVFSNPDQAPISSLFAQDLCEKMRHDNISFDICRQDDIYYAANRYIKGCEANDRNFINIVSESGVKREYYNFILRSMENPQAGDPSMYEKLAGLPFYLTINTNPDSHIADLFQRNIGDNKKCHFFYYDVSKKNNEDAAEKAQGQSPPKLPTEINSENYVVYNVYGYASDKTYRSVIIREWEFVEFAGNVNIAGNGMPVVIKNFIGNDKICLFLGFRYDSWALKILLRALGFSGTTPRPNISFSYQGLLQHQADYYRDDLKFVFIDSNPATFVNKLYQRYNHLTSSGSVANAAVTTVPKQPVKIVFISDLSGSDDACRDTEFRDKISEQLTPLRRDGRINVWAEDLEAAAVLDQVALRQRYNSADIFVIIGTANLVAHDEYYSRLEEAIRVVANDKTKKIMPVYVRHFMYESIPGIDEVLWIPRGNNLAVPIKDGEDSMRDKKLLDVCEAIKKEAMNILKSR